MRHLDLVGGKVGDLAVERIAETAVAVESGPPLLSRPQRTSSSSKPDSQPSPPGSQTGTKAGWTGPSSATSSQGQVAATARQRPMPRVGITAKRNRPLSTSITSTPSRSPPRSVRLPRDSRCRPADLIGTKRKLFQVDAGQRR